MHFEAAVPLGDLRAVDMKIRRHDSFLSISKRPTLSITLVDGRHSIVLHASNGKCLEIGRILLTRHRGWSEGIVTGSTIDEVSKTQASARYANANNLRL